MKVTKQDIQILLGLKGTSVEKIKEKISLMEYYSSGLSHINGGNVNVTKLRIDIKNKMVIADVTLLKDDDGDGESYKEKHKDCKYSFKDLGVEDA